MSIDYKAIRASFAKAKPAALEIVERFYEILFADFPAAKPLFAAVRMDAQKKALVRGLVFVVDHIDNPGKRDPYLKSMGARHVGYGVRDVHYDWVGQSLLKTFAEAFGSSWTPELESQWTQAYGVIAATMLEGARAAPPERAEAPVIPLAREETSPPLTLSAELRLQMRNAVRAAVQEVLQNEVQLVLEEELRALTRASLPETLRKQG
jgi:hemoglobin-like flavoprotein